MYVRDAKNREEVWLLDHIEEMGLDETNFRSRDYVIAIDEHDGAARASGPTSSSASSSTPTTRGSTWCIR